jgi:hypothetical protein
MSLGLSLNHLSASGNHTDSLILTSGSSAASHGSLYVTGGVAFGVPSSAGGEVGFTWPGTDTTFFVSGAVASDASATSFGTLGNYDIAVFGGNLQISGTISVDGSIRGGLEAKRSDGTAATPVANQVAFWTSNLFLSGTERLRWDDSDLVLNGNLQIQGAATTVSSSNFVTQDSVIGLGFSGSDTFNNVGQRSIIFGKNSSGNLGTLLPALSWDGTRAYTLGVPASPSSGTVDTTLQSSPSNTGGIYIPAYDSGELTSATKIQSTYGDGSHARALVFPVVQAGTVSYPGISGSADFQIDDGTKLSTLYTDRIHSAESDSFWNFDDTHAFRAKGTQGGSYDEVSGQWKFFHNTNVSYGGGTISAYPNSLKINAGNGIHLSASNSDVEVNVGSGQSVRTNYDNQASLGQAAVAWSDLFLADGATINLNTDVAANGSKITHSAGILTLSGNMDSTAPEYTFGTFSSFTNNTSGYLFTGPSTIDSSTTSLEYSGGFDATDVSELQSGYVIRLSGGGYGPYYFQVSSTPSVSDTSVSVAWLAGSTSSTSFGGFNGPYDHDFATSATPGVTYTMGIAGTAWRNLYADTIDLNGNQTTGSFILDADRDSAIGSSGDDVIDWFVGNISTSKFYMNASGLFPKADNSYDLGKSDKRYRNIFTGDVNLQNDRGDWTLIEENDFISFRNNMTGRRFRMVMEDITGMGNYGPGNDGEM